MENQQAVEYLLKSYHQIKREVESEKALLKLLITEREEELIEELNFKSIIKEKVKENRKADKTGNIAIKCIEAKENPQLIGAEDLKRKVRKKEMELIKLEAAVGILEEKEQKVIRDLYFERKTRHHISRELYISEVTLDRWKKKAVKKMGEWWGS